MHARMEMRADDTVSGDHTPLTGGWRRRAHAASTSGMRPTQCYLQPTHTNIDPPSAGPRTAPTSHRADSTALFGSGGRDGAVRANCRDPADLPACRPRAVREPLAAPPGAGRQTQSTTSPPTALVASLVSPVMRPFYESACSASARPITWDGIHAGKRYHHLKRITSRLLRASYPQLADPLLTFFGMAG